VLHLKKIVVVGAGYSGLLIAKKLAKKIKKKGLSNVEVTIIDKHPYHTMLTELHEVAACRVEEDSIRINIKKIFEGRKVNVVLDEITGADYDKSQLTGKLKTYDYDYLVMATGCKSTYFGIPGAAENAFPLWSYDEAVNLRDHIQSMFRQAADETDPTRKKALLTFYVIGSGFTGIEMIGELGEYAPIACKKFGIDIKDVTLHNVDFADKIMAFLPDKARNRAMKRLAKLGVTVTLKTRVTAVNADSIELEQNGTTKTDATHTIIWGAGTEGSDLVFNSEPLGLQERARGRIATDKYLRSLEKPNVYVAGDNIFYIPEGETTPVPQMVENCEHCAPVIATNILQEVQGKQPTEEYKPKFKGAMVCIGGKYGTAYGGLPGYFFVMPSFFAMFAKHFINVLYFFSILGYHKVFNYIKAEIFTIRDNRSFVGGHFSNKTPVFPLFPLRMFMGMYFIYYAYTRWHQSGRWLDVPLLSNLFENVAAQNRFAFAVPFTNHLVDYGFFGVFRFSVNYVYGTTYMWFQAQPMSWFLENFVVATPAQEMFWQTSIVLLCAALGLMFMAGFFTTLAAFIALAYALILMMTTGIPFYSWWLLFAPFAFMFTGGKVLSIDYYFMPWLKKKWTNIKFVKKWYLYN